MKRFLTTVAALAAATTSAQAGGIDRSGQPLGALFEAGRYFELSFGYVSPTIEGTDILGNRIDDVAGNYTLPGFSYKMDINDAWSFALNYDQPFGSDVVYGGDSATSMLGGTSAIADSVALTGILRYKFDENFSVHAGVRAQRSDGTILLSGLAYGGPPPNGLSGYNVTLDSDTAPGYVIGVAYEKPEIALRVALTYNSKVTHDFATTERIGTTQVAPGSETEVETPQSVNLDFQTGVAEDTLLFGNIRWVDWTQFTIDPVFFGSRANGAGLVNLEDTVTYTLGVGRRFNETWSGSFSLTYEPKTDRLVSPLSPYDGRFGTTVGVVYNRDNMKVTGGVNYSWLGDADPETGTPDAQRASMRDNTSVGVGVKVGWSF
jgi:long-chain fatty acid transport protein